MEDAIQSHRPRLTIGHWRLWLRRCKLHVPHARVATTKWDWTAGDVQGWVADWLSVSVLWGVSGQNAVQ